MSKYLSVWMSFGVLATLVLAAEAVECSEEETTLLKPKLTTTLVTQMTDCLMECTGMTYIRKLQLQDNRNIRLIDSTEGDLGEYCWSTELKCNTGESFQHAYVVIPVDTSAVGHKQLEVKSTVPTVTRLQEHVSPTTVAEKCGFRYDATGPISTRNSGTLFCVQVLTQEDVLDDTFLKCPPFMVTFWQRSLSQSN
ncbi:hypothetical protein JOB18_017963 [Solea senegalensis]|uniref:Uncharacterized protein n=1 Tax=Solea senegalensis TaxID=28829 RepID=A0AAV6R2M5_SOLSE|nr:hypothetical protein JOB18_017963 [Solea senegalensis]